MIFKPPIYHVRQFSIYNAQFLGVILDPLPTLESDVINGKSLTAVIIYTLQNCVQIIDPKSS